MAGDLTLKEEEEKRSSMEAAKKAQQPPTPAISRATKSRIQRNPLSDRTNALTSSKGTPFSPAANSSEEDAPGTSSNPLGLNSMPSCDFPSSSGVEMCRMIRGRPKAASTRKSKGKGVDISSTSYPNRRSNNVRVDRTRDIASSKQAPFFPSLNDPRVEAIKGDSPGTSFFDHLGLDSTPSRHVLSSSGCGDESQTIYRKATTTRNSNGKESLASSTTSSHDGRSSRIRKRPGEVEDRAVSKSCSVPNRKVRKSPSEAGDRAVSKSCTLPNKRKQHQPPPDTCEASESLQEFIRLQKSYFAEIDAFELPEEEASNEDSE